MYKLKTLFSMFLVISASTLALADEKSPTQKEFNKIQKLAIPDMVDIPAGSFMMGDINHFIPEDPRMVRATEMEQPVHKVKIKAFRLGKYEVTFAQYDVFAEATGKTKPDDKGNGRGQQPVGNVTWWEATAYADWLSQQTGKKFRLATEAEWQYAARAGTTTEYYWGNEASHAYANYGKDECCDLFASGTDKWLHAAPVGQFPPNKFGLYDMLGNVSEFVQDCMNLNYVGAPTDGSAWTSGNCSKHVSLGGQYHNNPFMIRVAARNFHPIVPERDINFGFRIAQDIE
ncbi:protein 3-oxoalanine-generating enzyme family protein [Cellvibrio zantedeschiae]|uniref:Protein 3-oxoalanine-generating enzyme family protein n=1 Tax=Cellvibrio zantedeschiae TaxID=1237077 RepID=A0ABQ3ARW2_9GAMM|nr:formylglycine-generating enzyme family protein [Cellvibrio zantedeschiae]GGY65870.1 protein 3-oxoalanine-generating enzyme family protein [Cellvibrio zantedeschiae]